MTLSIALSFVGRFFLFNITHIDMYAFNLPEMRMPLYVYVTVYCGPKGVLIMEGPLCRTIGRTVYCGPECVLGTVYCGPECVLGTVYCGPKGVLIKRVHYVGLFTVVPNVSSVWRFRCVLV